MHCYLLIQLNIVNTDDFKGKKKMPEAFCTFVQYNIDSQEWFPVFI